MSGKQYFLSLVFIERPRLSEQGLTTAVRFCVTWLRLLNIILILIL